MEPKQVNDNNNKHDGGAAGGRGTATTGTITALSREDGRVVVDPDRRTSENCCGLIVELHCRASRLHPGFEQLGSDLETYAKR